MVSPEDQGVNGKIPTGIGPGGERRPSRSARERGKRGKGVFVAVLGVNGLARAELNAAAGDAHFLALLAGEVHLDALSLGIEEGMVAEARRVESCAQLAIDASEQVEVEPCRNARCVIVRGIEDARILHEIDADDQGRAISEHAPGMAQKRARFVRFEIADGRSWKETGMWQSLHLRGQRERESEVRFDRQHRDLRVIASKLLRFADEHYYGNVYRDISGYGRCR